MSNSRVAMMRALRNQDPRVITNTAIAKEPRDINKKNPGKTYMPRFLDDSDVESLKDSVERELADISMELEQERQITSKIIPGSEFRGKWDACSDKYPVASSNSTWDVIVNCGVTHVFDGKTWEAGHQLIYLSTSNVYVQRTNPGTDGIKHLVDLLKVEVDKAKASIEENKIAIAETDFALASLSTELKAEIGKNTAGIITVNEVVVDLTKTVATNKTELEAAFKAADGEVTAQTDAKLVITNQTIADNTKAIASNKTELEASINSTNANLINTNKVVADNEKAAAEATTALRTEMNGQVAGINQSLSTVVNNVGELQSKWTVQADVNGYISGIEMVNNGLKSQFKILTDQFIVTDGSTLIAPLKIEGGRTMIQDLVARNIAVRDGDLNINNGQAVIEGNGRAVFQNADIRGAVRATSGEFANVIIHESCDFRGTIKANKVQGDVASMQTIVGSMIRKNGRNLNFSYAGGMDFDVRVTFIGWSLSWNSSKNTRLYLNLSLNGSRVKQWQGRDSVTESLSFDIPAGSGQQTWTVSQEHGDDGDFCEVRDFTIAAYPLRNDRFNRWE